jgi:glycosyltransferase involved in cell wall biosynthesis
MKILFATNFNYLPQRTGGSESSTHDLCTALQEKGLEAGVVCSLGMHDAIWLFNRISARLYKKKFIKDSLLPYPVFRGHNVKQGIYEVVNEFRPDIVVVQAGSPFELINSFSNLKIPVVYYARDIEFQRNTAELNINNHVGFIANSTFTANKLKDKFGVNALVIPPLIDPQKYQVSSSREHILHIGLVQEKGIEISFALAAKRPDIKFKFIESWPISKSEFVKYKKRAKTLRNVEILSRTSDMRKYYRSAKVVLVPSICEEAWGRVVTESQLSGIPTLASNRGGLPESVGSGGIIIPYDATIDH